MKCILCFTHFLGPKVCVAYFFFQHDTGCLPAATQCPCASSTPLTSLQRLGFVYVACYSSLQWHVSLLTVKPCPVPVLYACLANVGTYSKANHRTLTLHMLTMTVLCCPFTPICLSQVEALLTYTRRQVFTAVNVFAPFVCPRRPGMSKVHLRWTTIVPGPHSVWVLSSFLLGCTRSHCILPQDGSNYVAISFLQMVAVTCVVSSSSASALSIYSPCLGSWLYCGAPKMLAFLAFVVLYRRWANYNLPCNKSTGSRKT